MMAQLFLLTPILIVIWPHHGWFAVNLLAMAQPANLGLLALNRGGRLRLAAVLVVVEIWLLITIFALLPVGLGARSAWGFFIAVFCAGMLLGKRAAIATAAVCSATTLAIAILAATPSPHPWLFWMINTSYLAVMVFLQNLACRFIREAEAKTHFEKDERRQAEAALSSRERKHREMLDSLPFCIFEMDLQGKLTYVNHTALLWFGYSASEFEAGLNIMDIVDAVDRQRVRKNSRRILAGEEVPFHEYQVRRKNGSPFTALIRSRPIFENGKPVGLQGSVIDISDRKLIEEEREHIISLLKATVESTADGILVVDKTGCITHFNRRFAELWGIPEDVLAQQNDGKALDFVMEQLTDPGGFIAKVQQLYGEPLAESFDLLEFKDGRYFERYSRPQMLGGQPIGRVWSFRDISKRMRAEQETSAWKQRFESAIAASGQIFYDLEFATGHISCSGNIKEVLGYTITETDYDHWLELIPPQDRADAARLMEASMSSGASFQLEYGFQHGRGHLVQLLDRGFVVRDAAGRPERMIGMLEDITEKKRAAESLLESERRYRAVFEAANDAIFLMRGTQFIDCNRRTLDMYGCSRSYLSDHSVEQLSPLRQPDGRLSREKAAEKLNAAFDGRPQMFDWVHRRVDGTEFPAEVSLNRVELNSGTYLVAVVRDMSAHRQLEGQLLQAQKMEAIGILAGGVSHDFNNILSTIVGYASLMQMRAKGDELLGEYAERILASTERAVSLTHSLLAFSRKQEVDLQPLDVNNVIFGFHKILSRLIGEDIDFRLELTEQDLVVEADVRQFEQVLMNLATNSRDAMPEGGRLTIATARAMLKAPVGEIPANAYALITIRDTGSGMDEETKRHIFEPFFTTKEVGRGTGLGLAIVYGIILKHNGFIQISSQPGQGATFRIYLPLKAGAKPRESLADKAKIVSGTETILLIEDDAAVRQVVRSILQEFGYTVIEATNGAEGVAVFLRDPSSVDLVLCDLIMPGKNGRETIAEIRRARPDVKVIFISGYEADSIIRKGIVTPDIPVLLKPLKPRELTAKMRQILDS